jgi:hypothetical protein
MEPMIWRGDGMEEIQSDLAPVIVKPALIIDRIWGKSENDNKNKNEKLGDWFGQISEMEERFKTRWVSYQAIYLSVDQMGLSIFDSAKIIRGRFPLSPIYLIYENEPPIGEVELNRMGLNGMVSRANMMTELAQRRNQFSKIQLALEKASAKRKTIFEKDEDYLSSRAAPVLEGYLPVLLEDILTEELCFFDVSMLLPTHKKIKIFKANEPFDPTRVLKFLEEGVRWVYIRRESLGRCISYFALLCNHIVDNKSISNELKLLHIASKGGLLCSAGPITVREMPGVLSDADEVIDLLHGLITLAKSQPHDLVAAYFKHSVLMDHATSYCACVFLCSCAGLRESRHFETDRFDGDLS